MALGTILITAIPTPSGIVSSKYRDGDDSEASPPTDPQIGQPLVGSSTTADIPLVTASTGGSAPLAYELSLSTTSSQAGFSVADANADFTGDGVYNATGLTAATQYWVRLACVDADSRRSGYSGTFTFTTASASGGDVTAPTAPTNLSATSSTAGRASLTWTNGTDAVGIAYTDVLRGNSEAGVPTNSGTVIDTVAGTVSSYTDTSAPAGNEVFYRVQHRDAAGNVSSQSARVFVTIVSEPSGTKRWTPGHYIKTQGTDSRTDQSVYWTQVFNELDKAATYSPMKGAFVNLAWGSFNTTGSTFSWTEVDALFTKADSLGLKLIIAITYKNFATAVGLICPTDLKSAHTYATSSGWISAIWRTSVMNRYIAAYQAFATRYKDRSALESVSWSESAPSWASVTPPSDYSNSALSTQLQVLATSAVPMFPTSWVHCCINSLSGQLTQMLNNALSVGAGFATPDAVDTNGIRLFRGETVSGEQTPTQGDMRGRMLHHEIASQPTLGGKDDNGPPSNIINWAQTNKVTHLSWVTSVSTAPNTWADIKSAITADPLLYTTRPTG